METSPTRYNDSFKAASHMMKRAQDVLKSRQRRTVTGVEKDDNIPDSMKAKLTAVERNAMVKKAEDIQKLREYMNTEAADKAIRMLKEIEDPKDYLAHFTGLLEFFQPKLQRKQVEATVSKVEVRPPSWFGRDVDDAEDAEIIED